MKQLPENLLCFSHLRWDFVFQRPQHLLTRFSKELNVYFFEEPIADVKKGEKSYLSVSSRNEKLRILVPHIPAGSSKAEAVQLQKEMLHLFLKDKKVADFIFWYYTPMALEFSSAYYPDLIIYDCMDELSAFKNAPPELTALEKDLLSRADVVFTGGYSLYEAKKNMHQNIHPFPSSIDKEHFAKARKKGKEPEDQAGIPGKRLGFFGVIDERFDHKLIEEAASRQPDWQFVLIGPVVKINQDILPKNANIHYLGAKKYEELPAYLSGWDVALIPFQLNESTRFISPTKTPEYLAAGIPVISTPIRDVVYPYGKAGLVSIVHDIEDFTLAAKAALRQSKWPWLASVDDFLDKSSWNQTYNDMTALIRQALKRRIEAPISA